MSYRTTLRALAYSSIMYGASLGVPARLPAQETPTLLILDEPPAPLGEQDIPKIPRLELSTSPNATLSATSQSPEWTVERSIIENQPTAIETSGASRELNTEAIRERFKDGRVHIERHVALDRDGNYVNHGNYEEWSATGDVVCTGAFNMGQRQGPWIRFCQQKDAKLFSTQPYARFKSPFQSAVEFENGHMNGVWAITDADRRVVSQIQLTSGLRNGQCTWFYPSGQVMYQADYSNGILNGMFIEKSPEGKTVREVSYVQGQRLEDVKEQFANKSPKSETSYLTATQRVVTQDDWATLSLATYTATGERLKHGSFVIYHENGPVKMRGAYDHGVATGAFESWHPNGEKAVAGEYVNGKQHGKWSWWHPNGMRQSIASYVEGRVTGEVLAWNDQGKRIAAELAQVADHEHEITTAARVVPSGKQLSR